MLCFDILSSCLFSAVKAHLIEVVHLSVSLFINILTQILSVPWMNAKLSAVTVSHRCGWPTSSFPLFIQGFFLLLTLIFYILI